MKNYNLNLTIIPSSEINTLSYKPGQPIKKPEEWLKKKSLSTRAIKNYKTTIDCIINIILENIPPTLVNEIQLSNNLYYINAQNAPIIIEIITDFSSKYKLNIKQSLSPIIYDYEIKTYAEAVKEINNHIKILSDFLNLLHSDLSLVLISEYDTTT